MGAVDQKNVDGFVKRGAKKARLDLDHFFRGKDSSLTLRPYQKSFQYQYRHKKAEGAY